MERNWIEEIRDFIRKAMNKGFRITKYIEEENCHFVFCIFTETKSIDFTFSDDELYLRTLKGELTVPLTLSKRDKIELEELALAIEDYNEDMALNDFESFFTEKSEITINDLDDDDKE